MWAGGVCWISRRWDRSRAPARKAASARSRTWWPAAAGPRRLLRLRLACMRLACTRRCCADRCGSMGQAGARLGGKAGRQGWAARPPAPFASKLLAVPGAGQAAGPDAEHLSGIARLRRECDRLRMGQDISERSISIFAGPLGRGSAWSRTAAAPGPCTGFAASPAFPRPAATPGSPGEMAQPFARARKQARGRAPRLARRHAAGARGLGRRPGPPRGARRWGGAGGGGGTRPCRTPDAPAWHARPCGPAPAGADDGQPPPLPGCPQPAQPAVRRHRWRPRRGGWPRRASAPAPDWCVIRIAGCNALAGTTRRR